MKLTKTNKNRFSIRVATVSLTLAHFYLGDIYNDVMQLEGFGEHLLWYHANRQWLFWQDRWGQICVTSLINGSLLKGNVTVIIHTNGSTLVSIFKQCQFHESYLCRLRLKLQFLGALYIKQCFTKSNGGQAKLLSSTCLPPTLNFMCNSARSGAIRGWFHTSWAHGVNHRDSSIYLRSMPTSNFLEASTGVKFSPRHKRRRRAKTVYEIDPRGHFMRYNQQQTFAKMTPLLWLSITVLTLHFV